MKALALMLAIALTGCSWMGHRAKRIDPPSTAALHAAQASAEKSIAGAEAAVNKAGKHLGNAKQRHGEAVASHKAEDAHIAQAEKKTADLAMRVTAELRPEVDALADELISLRSQHSTTNAALLDTGNEIGESTVAASEALKAAQAAKQEQEAIRLKHSPEYEAKVADIVEKHNASEIARADISKKLMWYRLHWWGSWVVLILGIVGSIAFYVLKIAAKTR